MDIICKNCGNTALVSDELCPTCGKILDPADARERLVEVMEHDQDWVIRLKAAYFLVRYNDPRGKEYLKKPLQNKKLRDFAIGFSGWWIINGVVWGIVVDSKHFNGGILLPIVFYLAQWVTLLALAFTQRWIALGAIYAMAVNFAINIVMGLFINALCFTPFFYDFLNVR